MSTVSRRPYAIATTSLALAAASIATAQPAPPPADPDGASAPLVAPPAAPVTGDELRAFVDTETATAKENAQLTVENAQLKKESAAASTAPAQSKLAPTYPQFTIGGSAGLPWYSKGASLSVPVALGQSTDLSDASAEVRYTIDAYDGGFAVEKSTATLLSAADGGAPKSASAAMFAARVAFGSATKQATDSAAVCTEAAATERCAQIADGDYRVAIGWSGSVGLRVGAVTIDDNASAALAVEGVAEQTSARWGWFVSLTVDLLADNHTAEARYYGGAGGRVTAGVRFGNFNRVGAMAAAGGRTWTQGPDGDYAYDYSLDLMLFGVFEQVRLGAGVTRALNASADPDAAHFVPTLWLSPQI